MKKIIPIITFLLLYFNMVCYATPMTIEPVQPLGSCNRARLIELIGLIIFVVLIIIPIIKFVINKLKIKKEDLSDEEKEIESKILFKKFLKDFFILGGVGLVFKIISEWISTPIAKPIIYLYPEKEEKIKVKLGKKENLTCTYPKYNNEWNVVAKQNGDLIDIESGRKFYALYWEGKNLNKKIFEKGFCVKGEDVSKFLEEKLDILGLNEREANEFIVYWLPRLESNKYNLIKFICNEEMNEYMPLEINPKPDTIIRVMMQFKGINKEQEIKEQELKSIKRKGFTVVEWGGTEVK